jgi:hypothetical protein
MGEFLRFWGLIALVASIVIALTILLIKRFKKVGLYKYIPTIVIWLISLSFLLYSLFFAEPMQDLGFLVASMITGIATFITLIVTITIDVTMKRRK